MVIPSFALSSSSHTQLERIDADMKRAWRFYVLDDPDRYLPYWTNKGDTSMIGPNMPEDWFYSCLESKKPEVQMCLARYCPERFLPLMVGKKAREKYGTDTVEQVVEARMSGDPKRVWKVQFGKGGYYAP